MDFYVSLWCSSCLLFLSCFSPGWLFGLRDIPPEVTSNLVNRSYIQRNKPVHQHGIWTCNHSIITALVTTEHFTPPSVVPPALLPLYLLHPIPSFCLVQHLFSHSFTFCFSFLLSFFPFRTYIFFPFHLLSFISSSSLFLLSHSLTLRFVLSCLCFYLFSLYFIFSSSSVPKELELKTKPFIFFELNLDFFAVVITFSFIRSSLQRTPQLLPARLPDKSQDNFTFILSLTALCEFVPEEKACPWAWRRQAGHAGRPEGQNYFVQFATGLK